MTEPLELTTQDRLEILELFARYNWALEMNRPEDAGALFAEDGVFDGASGVYHGPAEVARMGAKSRASDGPINSQHWITNHVFTGTTERVEVRSMAMGPGMDGSTFHMTFQGYYVDDIVKVDGQWRFAYRYFRYWRGPVTEGAEPWLTERIR
ncbi:hypothetical protein GCM10027062_24280 [Nocardioides hungaricus]